jgi:kynurenine formamidase
MPAKIIDLSPTITEDMPERLMGPFFFSMLGMEPRVEFRHYIGEPPVYYLDTYITLFNHAGPHVDAPLHMIPDAAPMRAVAMIY